MKNQIMKFENNYLLQKDDDDDEKTIWTHEIAILHLVDVLLIGQIGVKGLRPIKPKIMSCLRSVFEIRKWIDKSHWISA